MRKEDNGNGTQEADEMPVSAASPPDDGVESAAKIDELAGLVMERARQLETQVNNNALINTTANLKNAIEYLGTVANAAMTRPMPEPVTPTRPGTKPGGCGCGDKDEGCDPARLPSCCVELYIRQVDVGRSDIGNLTDLECIVAVKGQSTWGMTDTGVAGFISLHPRSGPVPLNAIIERHCVPCNGTKTVPLWFQCREIDKVGRDEVGSERGFITLRCDCEIADVTQRVVVTGSVLGTFEIFITVGARVIPGGCC